MKRLIREYWVELAALLLLLLLILLWINWDSVSALFASTGSGLASRLAEWFQRVFIRIRRYFRRFSFSDLLFWLMILATLVFIAWRMCRRFRRSETWRTYVCPRCGGDLHRTHRGSLDRLLSRSLLPEARRFGCANPECGWSGLRHRREDDPHQRRRPLPEGHFEK